MKAYYLVRKGSAERAFDLRDFSIPAPGDDEILIENEAFGLNYADVMARLGHYRDAPPPPSIIGYDVVGRIRDVGKGVEGLKVGDRVAALTRFGGYATHSISMGLAAYKIGDDVPVGEAVALGTQYCTAWICCNHAVQVYPGDHVLMQAAAGGVGTALLQMLKEKGAIIFANVGSDKKIEQVKAQGADYVINYRKEDFSNVVRSTLGDKGLDIAFDSVGGKVFKKSLRLLGKGGRLVAYGAADITHANLFKKISILRAFGKIKPIPLLMSSRGLIGVNVLRIADHQPQILAKAFKEVGDMYVAGKLQPIVGGVFDHTELARAHAHLESRESVGKIVITW